MDYNVTVDDLLTYVKDVLNRLNEESKKYNGGINMNKWIRGGLLSAAVLGTGAVR